MAMTAEQIRTRGLAALRKELGMAGLVRFLQHFSAGSGDYVHDRPASLANLTMGELRQRVVTTRPRRKPKRD